jgi:uncharacterized membrane protein
MKSFEKFKESREKMDPTARKMSEHQWQQAYAAYCKSRKRLRESVGSGGGDSGESAGSLRRKRGSRSDRHATDHYAPPELKGLRSTVRAHSAYSDLRIIVDILAWVTIGMIIFAIILQLAFFNVAAATMVSLLYGIIQVIAVIVLRLLIHVLIDIPDIALYRAVREREKTSVPGSSASGEAMS